MKEPSEELSTPGGWEKPLPSRAVGVRLGSAAHGCACPAWAAAATALVTVLTSAMGYYLGGKVC